MTNVGIQHASIGAQLSSKTKLQLAERRKRFFLSMLERLRRPIPRPTKHNRANPAKVEEAEENTGAPGSEEPAPLNVEDGSNGFHRGA
uniref:Uncharacterized protein n=1 Tax=Caenorhabditis japonica TaxID=281687 RepID=A0A8R1IAG3_CAEJA